MNRCWRKGLTDQVSNGLPLRGSSEAERSPERAAESTSPIRKRRTLEWFASAHGDLHFLRAALLQIAIRAVDPG